MYYSTTIFGILVVALSTWVGYVTSQSDSDIVRVGNTIQARRSGVDFSGVTFLLNDIALADGILFAFSAFFRDDTKVRLQTWRLVPSNDSESGNGEYYTMVAEVRVIPAVEFDREDIYLESLLEPCILVRGGDRVGIFLEESPGAISYTFDAQNPRALSSSLHDPSVPNEVGDVVYFDTLEFPYDFNIGAFIYTNTTGVDMSTDRPVCPDLRIPSYVASTLPPTPTIPPPTGAAGATGPYGPQGNPGARGPVGATGVHGSTGDVGPSGQVGPLGPVGATGAHGERGEAGAVGPAGQAGPPVDPSGSTKEESMFGNPWLVLVALIWLAVVTLIIVILIVIVATTRRQRQKNGNTEDGFNGAALYMDPVVSPTAKSGRMTSVNSGPGIYMDPMAGTEDPANQYNNVSTDQPAQNRLMSVTSDDPQWIKGMKEESESQFSNDTIDRKDRRPEGGYVNHAADLSHTADVNDNQASEPSLTASVLSEH